MKSLFFALLVLLSSPAFAAEVIDWNDQELTWLPYDEGVKALAAKQENGIFIIYADWCPTCKAYSKLFNNPQVVAALKGVTLIRTNKDERPDISKQFSLDGEYVPRTFALNASGKVITDLNANNPRWWYYLPADGADYLIAFAQALKARPAGK